MVLSIKASRPGPEAAKHPTTITMLDRGYKVLTLECSVWFSSGTKRTHAVQKFTPLTHLSIEHSSKSFGDHPGASRYFFGKLESTFWTSWVPLCLLKIRT